MVLLWGITNKQEAMAQQVCLMEEGEKDLWLCREDSGVKYGVGGMHLDVTAHRDCCSNSPLYRRQGAGRLHPVVVATAGWVKAARL